MAQRPFFGDLKLHSPLTVDENGVPQVRPWVRFLARQVDQVLLAAILLVPLGLLWPLNFGVFAAAVFVTPITLSAASLALFGATAGKALLRIRVQTEDGRRPAFGKALRRELLASVAGVAVFTPRGWGWLAAAHGHLQACGEAPWDGDSGLVVRHRAVGFVRPILAVAIAATSLTLAIYAFNFLRQGGLGTATVRRTIQITGATRRTQPFAARPTSRPATRPATRPASVRSSMGQSKPLTPGTAGTDKADRAKK